MDNSGVREYRDISMYERAYKISEVNALKTHVQLCAFYKPRIVFVA